MTALTEILRDIAAKDRAFCVNEDEQALFDRGWEARVAVLVNAQPTDNTPLAFAYVLQRLNYPSIRQRLDGYWEGSCLLADGNRIQVQHLEEGIHGMYYVVFALYRWHLYY